MASAEQLQAQGVVWGGGGEGGEGAGPAAGYEEVELTVEARKGGEDMVEGAVSPSPPPLAPSLLRLDAVSTVPFYREGGDEAPRTPFACSIWH